MYRFSIGNLYLKILMGLGHVAPINERKALLKGEKDRPGWYLFGRSKHCLMFIVQNSLLIRLQERRRISNL